MGNSALTESTPLDHFRHIARLESGKAETAEATVAAEIPPSSRLLSLRLYKVRKPTRAGIARKKLETIPCWVVSVTMRGCEAGKPMYLMACTIW